MLSKKMMIIPAFMSAIFSSSLGANTFSMRTADGFVETSCDSSPLMENDPENLSVSRFIRNDDLHLDSIWDIPLRKSWWSRPHGYAWTMQFAAPDLVVLDAACGVSHPLKWYLADTCKETWACDTDPRIASREAIIQETYDDLGEDTYSILTNKDTFLIKSLLYKLLFLIFQILCRSSTEFFAYLP